MQRAQYARTKFVVLDLATGTNFIARSSICPHHVNILAVDPWIAGSHRRERQSPQSPFIARSSLARWNSASGSRGRMPFICTIIPAKKAAAYCRCFNRYACWCDSGVFRTLRPFCFGPRGLCNGCQNEDMGLANALQRLQEQGKQVEISWLWDGGVDVYASDEERNFRAVAEISPWLRHWYGLAADEPDQLESELQKIYDSEIHLTIRTGGKRILVAFGTEFTGLEGTSYVETASDILPRLQSLVHDHAPMSK